MAFGSVKRGRPTAKIISDKTFYITVFAVLFFGFFVNAIIVAFFADAIASMNAVAFVVFYIVSLLVGTLITALSKRAWLSFVGFCLVVLPLGAFLAVLIPAAGMKYVVSAFIVTACVTGAMALFSIFFPQAFFSFFKAVGLCVLVAFIAEIVLILCGFSAFSDWLDWLITLLFAAYIGADVAFCRSCDKTWDNAVDCACGLYVDIVYLFIRLIVLLARSKN